MAPIRPARSQKGPISRSKISKAEPPTPKKKDGKKETEEALESDGFESGSQSDGSVNDLLSEDEEDEGEKMRRAPPVQSYNSLLQSFQTAREEGHRTKRRKLESDTRRDATEAEIIADTAASTNANDAANEDPLEELEDVEDDEPAVDVSDDDEDITDPFEVHLSQTDESKLGETVAAIESGDWHSEKITLDELGQGVFSQPGPEEKRTSLKRVINSPKAIPYLKKRIAPSAQSTMPKFDSVQKALAPVVLDYHDLVFAARTVRNAESLRRIACLHALNHVFKTRDRVLKNNERLVRSADDADAEFRDQGFTRPKVLFLLETRENCARYAETLVGLCDPEQQENKSRFLDSYHSSEKRFADDRPEDFLELFEGNDDNEFRVGMKFTRKNVKFFSQFYASDIIFASPLGLRRAIEGKSAKSKDYDFLSSIEIVVLDQVDAMLMQNWEHLEFVFDNLNLRPKESHGCDFSRVRNWYLDGHAKYLRQTIAFSAYLAPELNALSAKHMRNASGKLKYHPAHSGAIEDLSVSFQIKQTFSKFQCPSPVADPDLRFEYFKTSVMPLIQRLQKNGADDPEGVLIFIPSYLDFVRLRNYFDDSNDTRDMSCGAISEYTSASEMRRARAHFQSGRHSVLLYTSRAHHFRRYRIKGVKRIFMYGLPENPLFYQEIVGGFLGKSIKEGLAAEKDALVRVVFSRWDVLKLERVVGSKRVGAMVKQTSSGDTFDFV